MAPYSAAVANLIVKVEKTKGALAVTLESGADIYLNEGVSYPKLIAEVWGKEVSIEMLHLYIRRPKHKLGIDSLGPYSVLNDRGEGYCFVADAIGD